MTDINTGGAAFPCEGGSDSGLFADPGMSLRDYFAAKALQGLLAGQFSDHGHFNLKELPKEAYAISDAMIAAREVQP
ncbi:hypothetical protein JQC79_19150 [Ochrobactrum anthropi]|uniref:hypothetical protein n=1 Tax=Brucella anthropi TaxID=529 RepID=UPI0019513D45|nr:hypothetical protein [Brucella anthropi]MBM6397872.1 hypothetical protein [Brucella anthropi]QTN04641.1 hypothetical protein GTN27_15570 [Ochrobactrum sp. EEELCW01]